MCASLSPNTHFLEADFTQWHSFIYNREELEDFLTRNLAVPHNREELFDNCEPKDPVKILRKDLETMYEDSFSIVESAKIKQIKAQKYEIVRQPLMRENGKLTTTTPTLDTDIVSKS